MLKFVQFLNQTLLKNDLDSSTILRELRLVINIDKVPRKQYLLK